MTWKEFKEKAESEGVTDDMDIWYIDISFPDEKRIEVYPVEGGDEEKNMGLVIHQ